MVGTLATVTCRLLAVCLLPYLMSHGEGKLLAVGAGWMVGHERDGGCWCVDMCKLCMHAYGAGYQALCCRLGLRARALALAVAWGLLDNTHMMV